jgi:hypothetical protein
MRFVRILVFQAHWANDRGHAVTEPKESQSTAPAALSWRRHGTYVEGVSSLYLARGSLADRTTRNARTADGRTQGAVRRQSEEARAETKETARWAALILSGTIKSTPCACRAVRVRCDAGRRARVLPRTPSRRASSDMLRQRDTHLFPLDVVHLYSESVKSDPPPGSTIVSQNVGPRRFEVRVFSLKRARLMDRVLPAISLFTVSIVGQRENKVLHGPRLGSGEHMRVVLRRGPGDAWTCISGFPVEAIAYMQARNSKRAKFPP